MPFVKKKKKKKKKKNSYVSSIFRFANAESLGLYCYVTKLFYIFIFIRIYLSLYYLYIKYIVNLIYYIKNKLNIIKNGSLFFSYLTALSAVESTVFPVLCIGYILS